MDLRIQMGQKSLTEDG